MPKLSPAPVAPVTSPAPGSTVRYTTADGSEIDARVIEADGDRLTLAYRSPVDGTIETAEAVSHGPNLVLHWFRAGERPAHPKGPEAGGRPILVGAPVNLHLARVENSVEHFEVVTSIIIGILDDGAFLAEPTGGGLPKRLRINAYSPDRFRKGGGWSWPEDGNQAPPPRRETFAIDRPVVCPVTGRSVPRKAAIPVSIGGTSAPDVFSNDGLLSPDGAAALRAFLAGDVETLTRAPVELVD